VIRPREYTQQPAKVNARAKTRLMRLLIFTLAAGCALASTACSPPIVGKWRSDKSLGNGEKNKLEVFDDMKADATIYATTAGDPSSWVRFDFDADWEDEGTEFDFIMKCAEGCTDEDNFVMECEVIDTDKGDRLDCTATKKWVGYVFNWEPDEDE
jgi:hypothetical protein